MNNNPYICLAKYKAVKDLGIGGIVILDNISGEKDTIVEPMVVVKVTFYLKPVLRIRICKDPHFF